MLSVMEASASNTCSPITIRKEEFVNQFRVAFVDECGRSRDWCFQVGEPVLDADDIFFSGDSYIKSIYVAGFFTVNAMPTLKHECSLAQKYIDKIALEKMRELVSTRGGGGRLARHSSGRNGLSCRRAWRCCTASRGAARTTRFVDGSGRTGA